MLQAIRERATGWVAYGIIGFLVVPFAFWGIDQYRGSGRVDVATVAGSEITQQEFQRALYNQQQRLQELTGQPLDLEEPAQELFKRQVLEQMVNERVLSQAARDQGFRISDAGLASHIRELPYFLVDGRFDRERYQAILRSQGLSEAAFEESERERLAVQQMVQSVQFTGLTSGRAVDDLIRLRDQRRRLAYATLKLEPARQAASVDEAEIRAYFEANRDSFMVPEQVRLEFLEVSAEKLAEQIPVSEEELQALYRDNIQRYRKSEQRGASHLLVRVEEGASQQDVEAARQRIEAIAADLEAGVTDFDQAMAAAAADPAGGAEGGELGLVAPGMMDPDFEAALFEMAEPGTVSPPVRSAFGFHLVRLDAIEPGSEKPFAEVREQVLNDYRQSQAEAAFYDLAEELANLTFEQPDSLVPAAEALGLEIQESEWLARDSQAGLFAHAAVRQAVFMPEVLRDGLNSTPLELGPTQVVVVRVVEHREAARQEFEQARELVEQRLLTDQAREAVSAAARELQARVSEAAGSLEVAAAELGAEWQPATLVGRNEPGIDPLLLAAAFRLPRPTAEEGPVVDRLMLQNGDWVVLTVESVEDGDPSAVAQEERRSLARSIARQNGEGDLSALLTLLRNNSDVKLFPDRL